VPGETSTGSIGILVSEVKYVEHQKAKKAMGDVGSGIDVINVMSGIDDGCGEGVSESRLAIRGVGKYKKDYVGLLGERLCT
jgi:hypothetical protein